MLYLDHINGKGVELFEQCGKLDLRGSGRQAEAEPLPQARREAAVGHTFCFRSTRPPHKNLIPGLVSVH